MSLTIMSITQKKRIRGPAFNVLKMCTTAYWLALVVNILYDPE